MSKFDIVKKSSIRIVHQIIEILDILYIIRNMVAYQKNSGKIKEK